MKNITINALAILFLLASCDVVKETTTPDTITIVQLFCPILILWKIIVDSDEVSLLLIIIIICEISSTD